VDLSPTISYGEILQAATVAVGGIGVLYSMHTRLTAVEKQISRLADVTERIARFEERQNSQEKRLDRLEERA